MRSLRFHRLVAGVLVLACMLSGFAVSAYAATEGESHGASAPLDFKTDLALWSLIVFVLFVLVLRKFAWGPLIAGLDAREAKFRQDLADAEAARVKAQQLLAEHQQQLSNVQDEVRGILAEARRDAEHTKQEIVAAAQREAELSKQRALDEIERTKDQALKELFDHMSAGVASATEHVLGRALTEDDQERLIRSALEQVSVPR